MMMMMRMSDVSTASHSVSKLEGKKMMMMKSKTTKSEREHAFLMYALSYSRSLIVYFAVAMLAHSFS